MKAIFTLTLGRTGTHYLAELFRENFPDAVCAHEYIGPDSFGMDSPDIGTMMRFNTYGNTQDVEDFWEKKLRRVRQRCQKANADLYVEASHQLAKGGLIEHLDRLGADVKIICLKRNPVPTALSFRSRGDFINITIPWLWYLDPRYALNLNKEPLNPDHGQDAVTLWYMKEMKLREEAYKRDYGHKYEFIDVHLEDISHPAGARKLFKDLGLEADMNVDRVVIPDESKRDASPHRQWSDTAELYEKIKEFMAS